MKRIIALIFAMVFVLLIFSACSVMKVPETKSEQSELKIILPEFKYYDVENLRFGRKFEIQKLVIYDKLMVFTPIGLVENYKFHTKGLQPRYSSSYPADEYSTYAKAEDTVWESDLPIYFTQNTENAEGIIFFERVPFSFYYDENGEPYVKCLERRFNDYFEKDKTYSDFIEWAKDYKPRLDDEDLLSR